MRVSPVGFAFDNINEVLKTAEESAKVTHNHPEGIKGANAVAASIFLARNGSNKEEIKDYIQKEFGYNLNEKIESIREWKSYFNRRRFGYYCMYNWRDC